MGNQSDLGEAQDRLSACLHGDGGLQVGGVTRLSI